MVRKAQSSMEYLIIFGIAIVMTMPLVIIYTTQTDNIRADITNAEVEKISSKIMDYAESVYYIGEPARKTLEVQFPAGITSVEIENDTITFNITTHELSYSAIKDTTSGAILTGTIKPFSGLHIITFIAEGNTVIISDK
jgi:hypothetical protein